MNVRRARLPYQPSKQQSSLHNSSCGNWRWISTPPCSKVAHCFFHIKHLGRVPTKWSRSSNRINIQYESCLLRRFIWIIMLQYPKSIEETGGIAWSVILVIVQWKSTNICMVMWEISICFVAATFIQTAHIATSVCERLELGPWLCHTKCGDEIRVFQMILQTKYCGHI